MQNSSLKNLVSAKRAAQTIPDSMLKLAVEKQRNEKLTQELAATQAQLQLAVISLEAANKVRPTKLAVKSSKARQSGDKVRVIIPDTHGSKVDKKALAAALGDIKALQPDEIILMGDHVDCGGFLALHHVMGYVAETEYSYEDDISATNVFLDTLQQISPNSRIEYIEGNHERRVETWCVTQTLRHKRDAEMLRQLFAPEFRLKLAEREIPYYRQGEYYDGLSVPGIIKRGKCFFVHGFSTARNAVAATQSKVCGNVVAAHTHRAQADIIRPVSTGVIGSWNPGCLCELNPLWQHTRPTDWTQGIAVQLIAKSGNFLHLNIPIIEGKSLFGALVKL
jgi:hypothetical protein